MFAKRPADFIRKVKNRIDSLRIPISAYYLLWKGIWTFLLGSGQIRLALGDHNQLLYPDLHFHIYESRIYSLGFEVMRRNKIGKVGIPCKIA